MIGLRVQSLTSISSHVLTRMIVTMFAQKRRSYASFKTNINKPVFVMLDGRLRLAFHLYEDETQTTHCYT